MLLVEDHPANRKVVELLLARRGMDLAMAEDGAQGVEAWRSGAFDVVLMDLQMPVMDGLTAIRAIRAIERAERGGRRTPIAALNANAMEHHRREAIKAGADLHIPKPVTAQALVGGIRVAMEGRQQGTPQVPRPPTDPLPPRACHGSTSAG